jgi:hypothetical protein
MRARAGESGYLPGSHCPGGKRRAGKLWARILGWPAVVDSGADGDRAAPGAACLADTARPVGGGLHVLDMLGSCQSYDLRMHCNLLKFGP